MSDSMSNRERVERMLAEGAISQAERDELIAAMGPPKVERPRPQPQPEAEAAPSLEARVEDAARTAGEALRGLGRGLKEGLDIDDERVTPEAIGRAAKAGAARLLGWATDALFLAALVAGLCLSLFMDAIGLPLMLSGAAIVGMLVSRAFKRAAAALLILGLSSIWSAYAEGAARGLDGLVVLAREHSGGLWPVLRALVLTGGYALLVLSVLSIFYVCVVAALERLERRGVA